MFRIRFHGRGGQGMKTASRIVGKAAFRQGYDAQDSPVYGAERRGAPMIAFTRFDAGPIFERGSIISPDLVVIADESFLTDPRILPLHGLSSRGCVLINSIHSAEELQRKHAISNMVVAHDFTALALSHAGSLSALSVAVGASTAKLVGLEDTFIERAVLEELESLDLNRLRIEKNLELARACCAIAAPDQQRVRSQAAAEDAGISTARIVTPVYEGPWSGTASVATKPNTPLRRTGDWRVMRPSIDIERCTRCWICFVDCPDGAIALEGNDIPHIDYGVCKGCLICVEECPIDAIDSQREAETS
jgi:pyruvate ferredoxin oxidoreductase gamma subunit